MLKLAMSDESFLDRRRAINRRAAAKSRRRLKEHANRVKSVIFTVIVIAYIYSAGHGSAMGVRA